MKQKLLQIILSASLFAGLLAPALPVYAAGASISLTANRATVPAGGSLIIAVYMNGGGAPINAVQADLTYPASKLQYVGFSASGSAFEIGATSGGGDGSASLARGTISSVSGSGLVGTVTFKALAGSGSASISVAGSSSLVADGSAVPYGSSGVSVSFGAAAAASGSSSVAAKPAAPAPPKDTTAPVITVVKPTGVTAFAATVTWTTSEPADSVVEYGLDNTYGLSTSVSAPSTAHSVVLNSSFLTPLTLLHYRVKSTDGAGNVATGTDQTLQLPGVPVTVIVKGPDGKPQPGATVTLDGATGTTDSAGSVTLASGLGNKKITTVYQGVSVQKPITVAKTAKPLPPYQLDLAKKPLNPWMLTSIGLFVVTLTLLAIDAMLFGSRVLARVTGLHFTHHTPVASSVTASAPHIAETPLAETPAASPAPASSVRISRFGEPKIHPPAPAATVVAPPPSVESAPPLSVDDGTPLDPESSVARLMGDEPLQITPPSEKAAPLTISLKPLLEPEPTAPLIASAPKIAVPHKKAAAHSLHKKAVTKKKSIKVS
jgi:hypothetical protein